MSTFKNMVVRQTFFFKCVGGRGGGNLQRSGGILTQNFVLIE